LPPRIRRTTISASKCTRPASAACASWSPKGLANQRIIQHDAVEVLRDMIAPATLAGVHIFFPDPWPKKRHHKRRLLQPPLSGRLLASRCSRVATFIARPTGKTTPSRCWPCCRPKPLLENTAIGYAPRPDYRPLTKFEQRGLRLGHGVWDLVFRRRPASLDGR
jgi:tRNA (guanine-N7-)-methyltransferase